MQGQPQKNVFELSEIFLIDDSLADIIPTDVLVIVRRWIVSKSGNWNKVRRLEAKSLILHKKEAVHWKIQTSSESTNSALFFSTSSPYLFLKKEECEFVTVFTAYEVVSFCFYRIIKMSPSEPTFGWLPTLMVFSLLIHYPCWNKRQYDENRQRRRTSAIPCSFRGEYLGRPTEERLSGYHPSFDLRGAEPIGYPAGALLLTYMDQSN